MSNNPIDSLETFKVMLNDKEVTGFVTRFSICQSIDQPLMTSTVSFSDLRAQTQQSPAGAKLEISVTPNRGKEIKVSHIVDKVDNTRLAETGKYISGDVRGVAPEYKSFVTKRHTKSYEGLPPNKIIETVLKDSGSNKKIDAGSYKNVPAQFLSNKNTTMEVVDKAKKYPGVGSKLYFWEGPKGFNLKSVDELMKQQPVAKLVYDHAASTNISRSMSSPNNIFDIDIDFGSYGDTLVGERGQDTLITPSGNQQKTGDKADGIGQGFKSRLQTNQQDTELNKYIRNTKEQYTADRGKDFSKQEQSLANLTASVKILVTLRPDITAGSVIEVKSGGGTGFSDADTELSHNGKWLVKRITHVCDFTDGSGSPYGRSIIECVGKIK